MPRRPTVIQPSHKVQRLKFNSSYLAIKCHDDEDEDAHCSVENGKDVLECLRGRV